MRFLYFFYVWVPAVLVGAVVILTLPWLAVIALIAALLATVAALGSLAWAGLAALNGLSHSSRDAQALGVGQERVDARSRT